MLKVNYWTKKEVRPPSDLTFLTTSTPSTRAQPEEWSQCEIT